VRSGAPVVVVAKHFPTRRRRQKVSLAATIQKRQGDARADAAQKMPPAESAVTFAARDFYLKQNLRS